MIYLTGDTHGDFRRIAQFCARMNTQPSDIMIILGDAGINFSGGWYDEHNKKFNGRFVRNVYEKSLNTQALRLSTTGNFSVVALKTITVQILVARLVL